MLTKSKFKIGVECPTRLFYHNRSSEYDNQNVENPFLDSLAEGGFQVGEMAKFLLSNDPITSNFTIEEYNREKVLAITESRLNSSENISFAEAGFEFDGCYVRVDLINKRGNQIDIFEVKSASIFEDEEFFNSKTGEIDTKWLSYILDVAFQHYVAKNILEKKGYRVTPHLILVNKSQIVKKDGLNQFFQISSPDGLTKKVVVNATFDDIREDLDLLSVRSVSKEVNWLLEQKNNHRIYGNKGSFEKLVEHLKFVNLIDKDWVKSPVGAHCKSCSFYSKNNQNKCGRSLCFSEHEWDSGSKSVNEIFSNKLILELWLGKGGAHLSKDLWKHNIPFISELDNNVFERDRKPEDVGFNPSERRQIQIQLQSDLSVRYKFNREAFEELKVDWEWPLNMIDFETNTSAIPFFKGMRPYQTVAFQFSHHTLDEGGEIRHLSQWLSFESGRYPNFDFVRELKNALSVNNGTIFRYATHENSVLSQIKQELHLSQESDKDELIDFIVDITEEKFGKNKIRGDRNMVDLLEVVLSTYYSQSAGGSNSIKAILPAIIQDVAFLKNKYSKLGLYGRDKKIHSLNFEQHIWLTKESNWNPYKTLPLVFNEDARKGSGSILNVADGGAAMNAYTLLQFQGLTKSERKAYKLALLRYCELDTMAMVMIIEGLMELSKKHS
jgi:hypothetical protein